MIFFGGCHFVDRFSAAFFFCHTSFCRRDFFVIFFFNFLGLDLFMGAVIL